MMGGPSGAFGSYASWGTRAMGWLVDLLPIIVLSIVTSLISSLLNDAVNIAVAIFYGYQVGEFGQTPGMRVAGVKCISARDGQNIGAGLGIVRWLASILNSLICFVGWFFPLWDQQRQLLSDKIMSTVVIDVPKQSWSLMPKQ